ncbi:MAG: hypothetical protein E8D42_04445 [Nitrospira sp.]|nr:MAG: hypothetical protein E8D42_04445 [Nitrospira sp.]
MLTFRRFVWLLAIFIILSSTPLYAQWMAIDAQYQSHPLQMVYVDAATIHREGNLVTISALIDWKWMQGNRSPTRFYSTKITKQFDCTKKRVRNLESTDFYGHMGTGEVIGGGGHTSEGHWVGAEPGTVNEGLWGAVCGKK